MPLIHTTVGKDDLDEFKVGTYKKATDEMVEKINELKAETNRQNSFSINKSRI